MLYPIQKIVCRVILICVLVLIGNVHMLESQEEDSEIIYLPIVTYAIAPTPPTELPNENEAKQWSGIHLGNNDPSSSMTTNKKYWTSDMLDAIDPRDDDGDWPALLVIPSNQVFAATRERRTYTVNEGPQERCYVTSVSVVGGETDGITRFAFDAFEYLKAAAAADVPIIVRITPSNGNFYTHPHYLDENGQETAPLLVEEYINPHAHKQHLSIDYIADNCRYKDAPWTIKRRDPLDIAYEIIAIQEFVRDHGFEIYGFIPANEPNIEWFSSDPDIDNTDEENIAYLNKEKAWLQMGAYFSEIHKQVEERDPTIRVMSPPMSQNAFAEGLDFFNNCSPSFVETPDGDRTGYEIMRDYYENHQDGITWHNYWLAGREEYVPCEQGGGHVSKHFPTWMLNKIERYNSPAFVLEADLADTWVQANPTIHKEGAAYYNTIDSKENDWEGSADSIRKFYQEEYCVGGGDNYQAPIRIASWLHSDNTQDETIPISAIRQNQWDHFNLGSPLLYHGHNWHKAYTVDGLERPWFTEWWRNSETVRACENSYDKELVPKPTPRPTLIPPPCRNSTSCSGQATPTPSPSPTPYYNEPVNCTVQYNIQSHWHDGFVATPIQITNNGSQAIDGWELAWSFSGDESVTRVWNGLSVQSGQHVTVQNDNWNSVIPPNQTKEIGFEATYTGSLSYYDYPTEFSLNGEACEVILPPPPEPPTNEVPNPTDAGCLVEYHQTGDWGNGFVVNPIKVTNTSGQAINSWVLSWEFPDNQTIRSLWNGQYTQTGNEVVVSDDEWNKHIGNNLSLELGFEGRYTAGNMLPTAFNLNGMACEVTIFPEPPPEPPDPSDPTICIPQLVTPNDNAAIAYETLLDWTGCETVAFDFYEIRINLLPQDTNAVVIAEYKHAVQTSEYVASAEDFLAEFGTLIGGTYYDHRDYRWEVRACTVSDCGGWSESRYFSVEDADVPNLCEIEYTISTDWGNGFIVNPLNIYNLGTTDLDGWRLEWTFTNGQTISSFWNGIVTQTGQDVSVVDSGWNGVIGSGASVSIGFEAGYSGGNGIPTEFRLNGGVCTVR